MSLHWRPTTIRRRGLPSSRDHLEIIDNCAAPLGIRKEILCVRRNNFPKNDNIKRGGFQLRRGKDRSGKEHSVLHGRSICDDVNWNEVNLRVSAKISVNKKKKRKNIIRLWMHGSTRRLRQLCRRADEPMSLPNWTTKLFPINVIAK